MYFITQINVVFIISQVLWKQQRFWLKAREKSITGGEISAHLRDIPGLQTKQELLGEIKLEYKSLLLLVLATFFSFFFCYIRIECYVVSQVSHYLMTNARVNLHNIA